MNSAPVLRKACTAPSRYLVVVDGLVDGYVFKTADGTWSVESLSRVITSKGHRNRPAAVAALLA